MSSQFRHSFFWSLVIWSLVIFTSVPPVFAATPFPSRQDGEYIHTGYISIDSVSYGPIDAERKQIITVKGDSMPRSMIMVSQACEEIAILYGSSRIFRFGCILEKNDSITLRLIDSSSGRELFHETTNIREVYSVTIRDETYGKKRFVVKGMNLPMTLDISSPECREFALMAMEGVIEAHYVCTLFSPEVNNLSLKILTRDKVMLFEDSFFFTPIPPPIKKNIKKTIIDSNWLTIVCELWTGEPKKTTQKVLLLEECALKSPFMTGGSSIAEEFDPEKETALNMVTESKAGVKDISVKSIGKIVELLSGGDKRASAIKYIGEYLGLRISPAKGYEFALINVPQNTFLMGKGASVLGIGMDKILGYPMDFEIGALAGYDQGYTVSLPSAFPIKKPRSKSEVVINIGTPILKHQKILTPSNERLKKLIGEEIGKSDELTDQKKLDLGLRLVKFLNTAPEKQTTQQGIFALYGLLKVTTESFAFYENLDLTFKGKLLIDPFRPSSWKKDSSPKKTLELNVGEIEGDFAANSNTLKLTGNFLNSVSIFNADVLKAEQGLIKAGLLINLKKDDGTVTVDLVALNLPGKLGKLKAFATITHLFKPENIAVNGTIKSEGIIRGFPLVLKDAEFFYDPNATYDMPGVKGLGLLDIETVLELGALGSHGRAVFSDSKTESVMDMGGEVFFYFLGFEKKILDMLSRTRISEELLRTCMNSTTGKAVFSLPFVEKEIKFEGDMSMEGELGKKDRLDFHYLAMSGQNMDSTRMGFKLTSDPSKKWLYIFDAIASSEWNEKCSDSPGPEFLSKVRSLTNEQEQASTLPEKQIATNLIASIDSSSSIIAQALERSTPKMETLWDVSGWKIIGIVNENGNRFILLDKAGNEVSLQEGSFAIPGLWKFENPLRFVIYDEKAFRDLGYTFAIEKRNDLPVEFGVASYTQEEERNHVFKVSELAKGRNRISVQDVEKTGKIKVLNQDIAAQSISTRAIGGEELKVEAEVSSTPFSEYPSEQKTDFSDIRSPVLNEAINFLVQKKIVTGYPDGTFKPDKPINHAEATVMLQAARKIMKSKKSLPKSALKSERIVNRAEFIKMLISMLEEKPKKNLSRLKKQFKDVKKFEWYVPYASAALERNLLDKGKMLRPAAPMTRGDAALMIYRMMKDF